MEQKILNMFEGSPGTSESCLGMKYASNGNNVWSMEYQGALMSKLFGKKMNMLKPDRKLNMLNNVFHEDAFKMEYYNMVKKGYLADQDAVKERGLDYF